MNQIDSFLESLGIWAFPVTIPVIVACVLCIYIGHEAIAGFTRGLSLWPKPGRFGFLHRPYWYFYTVEGQVWFGTWAFVVVIFILKTICIGAYWVLESTAGKASRASAKAETIARKLAGP